MRAYRPAPTVLAAVLFLAVANCALIALIPERPENLPQDEAQLLYFGLMFQDRVPDTVDQAGLERLLAALDPDAENLAEKFTVVSWHGNDDDFELVVRHNGDGKTYCITPIGVAHGA